MKKLSYWGKINPWKTRGAIVLMQVLLAIYAALTGIWLYAQGWAFPAWFLSASIVLFLLASFFYPDKTSKYRVFHYSYFGRKAMDTALIIISLFMVLTVSNQYTHSVMTESPAFRAEFMVHKTPSKQLRSERKSIREAWKQQRQTMKAEVKSLVREFKAQKKITGGQVGLIALTILGALILLYILAVLSCSISCSGMEGLAILVALTGLGLVVWLSIFLIKKIMRKKVVEPSSS